MYLQSGWGDGDQAGGAGSVSEAGSGWELGWAGLGSVVYVNTPLPASK